MQQLCWTMSNASEGIGRTYPQHQAMRPDYDYDAPNSVHRLPYDALPDFEPDFDTVIIHGHAKLTDLLSSAPIKNTGYLVSPGLRALLERFTLPLHRFYPVPMTHRKKLVAGYCWLQLPEPRLPLMEGSSIAEAEEAIAAVAGPASLDLLRLYQPTRFMYCFISARLRRAMESVGVTGVRFGTSKLFRPSVAQGAPNKPLQPTAGAFSASESSTAHRPRRG
jgi:hypothetical protein